MEKLSVLLKDGVFITVTEFEGETISATIPDNVLIEVSECESVVKGQTATSSYKPAMIKNEDESKEEKIMVPQFISVGDIIEIKPDTFEYVRKHT